MCFGRLALYGLGVAVCAMLLAPTGVSAQTTTSPGYYVNQNNPLGPHDPDNPNAIWSLDKSSGGVRIHYKLGSTPAGGRGPTIPYILQYNSGSTISMGGPEPFSSVTLDGTFVTWIFNWQSAHGDANSGAPGGPWTSVFGPSLFRHWDTGNFSNQGGSITCGSYAPNLWADSEGQVHDLRVAVSWLESGNEGGGLTCQNGYAPIVSAETLDGSAISATITGFKADGGCSSCPGTSGGSPAVIGPDGTIADTEDTNGNLAKYITVTQNGKSLAAVQDSLGRTIATSAFGAGSTDMPAAGTYTVTTTGPNGEAENYIVTVVPESPTWGFSRPHPTTSEVSVVNAQGTSTVKTQLSSFNVISNIELPNKTSYSFTYDPVYGTVSYIYFPTGGYVHFVWNYRNIGMRSSVYSTTPITALSTVVATEVDVNDGTTTNTWQYAYPDLNTSTGALVTNETAPDGTKTAYTYMPYQFNSGAGTGFPDYLETTRAISNSAGKLIKTVSTAYNVAPFPSQIATTFYDGANPLQRQVQYAYDSHGNVTEQDESDFYSCTGSPCTAAASPTNGWLRKTLISYWYASHPTWVTSHIINKPFQVLVTDNVGHPFSLVQYGYDETAVTGSAGIYNHDDTNYGPASTLPRGNLTSESHCMTLNTATAVTLSTAASACSAWAVTTNAYDLAGQKASTKDPNGNVTTFSYTDSYAEGVKKGTTDGYVTTVTYPNLMTDKFTYNLDSGQTATHTDWNNNTTQYSYLDPGVMSRLTEITYPDTGTEQITYNDPAPVSIVTTRSTGEAAGSIVHTTTYDGLGRVLQTQVNSELTAVGVDYVDYTYDKIGRLQSVSNPYRTKTDGIVSYVYDALGRNVLQCQQDNSASPSTTCSPGSAYRQWTYAGNVVTFQDELLNQWQKTSDGLGRLQTVLEPNGTTKTPSLVTDYFYDVLNNLTCAEQHGGVTGTGCSSASSNDATSQWRVRRFAYDGLSRLTSSTNPEAGLISYTYDPNGNVAMMTTPAKNATTGTQTLAYCYDSLNRMTYKFYSGTFSCKTPSGFAASYTYDTSAIAGAANVTGRLTDEKAFIGSTLISERSPYKYDAMGRETAEQQTPYKPTSGTFLFLYAYDFAGNLTCQNNGFASLTATNSCTSLSALASTIVEQNTYDGAGHLQYARSTLVPTAFSAAPSYLLQANSSSPAAYDPSGRLVSAQVGLLSANATPGLQWTHQYDSRGRLASEVAGTVYSFGPSGTAPEYDAVGNLTNYSDSVMGDWGPFTYDSLNRVQSTHVSSGTYSGEYGCWTYDAWGNRTLEAFTQKTTTPCATGAPIGSPYTVTTPTLKNQVSGSSYDAAGDVIGDGRNNYAYDAEGRVCAKATGIPGGGTSYTEYLYDAEGRRVGKASGTSRSCAVPASTPSNLYLLGLGGEQVTEINSTGTPQHSNFVLPGGLTATYDFVNIGLHLAFGDQLGTKRVQASLKSSGTVVTVTPELNFQSFPFGNNLTNTFAVTTVPVGSGGVDATEHQYTGKERDTESGNDYFGARYYASSMGRWMSPDWAAQASPVPYATFGDPQSLNLYQYVRNNPLTNRDADGHECPPTCASGENPFSGPPAPGGSANPQNSQFLQMVQQEGNGLVQAEPGRLVMFGGTTELSTTTNAGFVQINSTGSTTLQAVPGVGQTVDITMHAPGATPNAVSVSAGTPVVSASATTNSATLSVGFVAGPPVKAGLNISTDTKPVVQALSNAASTVASAARGAVAPTPPPPPTPKPPPPPPCTVRGAC